MCHCPMPMSYLWGLPFSHGGHVWQYCYQLLCPRFMIFHATCFCLCQSSSQLHPALAACTLLSPIYSIPGTNSHAGPSLKELVLQMSRIASSPMLCRVGPTCCVPTPSLSTPALSSSPCSPSRPTFTSPTCPLQGWPTSQPPYLP